IEKGLIIGDVDDQDFDEVRRGVSAKQIVELLRLGCGVAAALSESRCRPGGELMEVRNLRLDPCVDLLAPYVVVCK
ncbi:unnamed protein product, partial [marine sediment metagenome]